MKVRDRSELVNQWPPQPGDVHVNVPLPMGGEVEEAVLTDVRPANGKWVTFQAEYKGNKATYDVDAKTPDFAAKLTRLLGLSKGKNLSEVGDLEVPE